MLTEKEEFVIKSIVNLLDTNSIKEKKLQDFNCPFNIAEKLMRLGWIEDVGLWSLPNNFCGLIWIDAVDRALGNK